MRWSKVHSSSDNHKQNTHRRTLFRTCSPPPLLIEARVPPTTAREASSCSTYTHSFPSPPSHLIPSDGPPGSGAFFERLSCTFSSLCFLKSLLSIYESSFCSLHVSIYGSVPFAFISLLFHQREKQTEGWQFQFRASSQNHLHLDFITDQHLTDSNRTIIRGKKIKEGDGVGDYKACNIVNNFKISIGIGSIMSSLSQNLNVNQLL